MATANKCKVYLIGCLLAASFSSTLCCPKECSCKWKSGKRTAECSDRGFISIPVDIENETQVLDISGNDLQILQQNAFKNFGLISLQKMYVRSCKIGQIDQGAFQGLQNLVEIDLSHNLLIQVPFHAFVDIPYLRNISFANNPIKKIDSFTFSLVPQLAKLDLAHCNIQSIRPNAFDQLHVLDHLKLNNNELQTLSVDVLDPLKKLRTLELHGNNWKCDCYLRGVKIWISNSGVHIPESLFCSAGPERLKDEAIFDLDTDDFACKPSIKTDIRYLEAVVGSNITIECRVESDPAAKINWFFEKMQLSNNSVFDIEQRLFIIESEEEGHEQKSKLVLRKVEESDAGMYHCVADNRAGSAEVNFTLRSQPATNSLVALSSTNVNVIVIALGIMILTTIVVVVIVVRKINYFSYSDDDDDDNPKHFKQPEKNSLETSSQQSQDSAIKSESGKAFTVTSDLSYSRSMSDIGNARFSNPDLISGATMRDSTCITPLPITRPISDYCQNWQKSCIIPSRATSSSAYNYDIHDRMPVIIDTGSAGSGSDDVFAHSRMSDYPPDYGLPILPENEMSQPCAKTLKVWQRGVPVLPPMCSGPPTPAYHQSMPAPVEISYPRCGTDV